MLIRAEQTRVQASAGRRDLWQRAAAAVGYRLEVAGSTDSAIWTGDELVRLTRFHRRAGLSLPARSHLARVVVLDSHPSFTVITGPALGLRVTVSAVATGAGTLVTIEAGNPDRGSGVFDRLLGAVQARHRARVLWALRMIIGLIHLDQHMTQVVVAGAVIRDGAVLAARRTYPPEAAGRWEFPGGKVGPGENDLQALRRELREELGIDTEIGARLGPEISLDVETVLRLYAVDTLSEGIAPDEHDELRWLTATQLEDVDWLDADRELLPAVRPLL